MANRVQIIIDALDNTKGVFDKLDSNLKALTPTLNQLIGGAISFGALSAAIGSSVKALNQMERANIGLASTARYAGVGISEATDAAKKLASDGLMSVVEASQSLQNLLSRGYNLEESIQLMNRLKDSAAFNRQAHLEFGQAIVGATEGLKNENSMLVDNAGVTKNVSVMWKEYAAQTGVSVNNLTQAQKRQAEFNGILRETEGQLGNAARMSDTFQGSQARLNQQLFEAKSILGQALVPALGAVMTALKPIIEGFRNFIGGVAMMGTAVGTLVSKAEVLAEVGMSGKGIFSKEGLDIIQKRFKQLDQVADEEYTRIYNKFTGATPIDIGKDTGKRRSDIVLPQEDKEGERRASQYIGIWNRLQDRIKEMNPSLDDYQKEIQKVNDEYDTLIGEYPEHAKELNHNRDVMLSWVTAANNQKNAIAETSKEFQEYNRLVSEQPPEHGELAENLLYFEKEIELIDSLQETASRDTVAEQIKRVNLALENMPEIANKAVPALEKLNMKLKQMPIPDEPLSGITAGLATYAESALDVTSQIKGAVQNTFKGMEDTLTNFVKTGKMSFKDLANSIIEDLIRITIRTQITGPLAQAMSGASFASMFGFANGGAFEGGVQKFATGGIVTNPTYFGMSSGVGLMGEAGPEAIMPLTRTSSGALGVKASPTNQNLNVSVNVINQTNQSVTAKTGNTTFDGKQFVVNTIIENVQNNGALRGLMSGAGGY